MMNCRNATVTYRQIIAVALIATIGPLLSAPVETWAGENKRIARVPVRDRDRRTQVYLKSWMDIRTQNIVMQQRDYSCGAAALATLIKYHWGGNVTETQLLLETGRMLSLEELKDRIQRGLSLTDLRRLAVRVDYLSTIGRLSFEKLRESKIPLIVGIVVNGYDHFVVVRGVDEQYVYLADPARGHVRTPIPDFVKQWQKNLVLVVVKKGVDAKSIVSPLTLHLDEKFLGELNRYYARDRVTTNAMQ